MSIWQRVPGTAAPPCLAAIHPHPCVPAFRKAARVDDGSSFTRHTQSSEAGVKHDRHSSAPRHASCESCPSFTQSADGQRGRVREVPDRFIAGCFHARSLRTASATAPAGVRGTRRWSPGPLKFESNFPFGFPWNRRSQIFTHASFAGKSATPFTFARKTFLNLHRLSTLHTQFGPADRELAGHGIQLGEFECAFTLLPPPCAASWLCPPSPSRPRTRTSSSATPTSPAWSSTTATPSSSVPPREPSPSRSPRPTRPASTEINATLYHGSYGAQDSTVPSTAACGADDRHHHHLHPDLHPHARRRAGRRLAGRRLERQRLRGRRRQRRRVPGQRGHLLRAARHPGDRRRHPRAGEVGQDPHRQGRRAARGLGDRHLRRRRRPASR